MSVALAPASFEKKRLYKGRAKSEKSGAGYRQSNSKKAKLALKARNKIAGLGKNSLPK